MATPDAPELARTLTRDERRVLDLLLSQEFPGAAQLREQARLASVVGRCSCGCASIVLSVDHEACAPAIGSGSPVWSEAAVVGEDGMDVGGVILFLKEGYLEYLEIYSGYGPPIREWPPAERLRLWLRSA
jgi:hypothetical protein